MKLRIFYLIVFMSLAHLFSKENTFFDFAHDSENENHFLLECVNPASGKLTISRTDFVIEAIEPIILQRTYSSQYELSYDGGWHFFPTTHLSIDFAKEIAMAKDSAGNLLFFHKEETLKDQNIDIYRPSIDKDSPNMAFSQKEISARTNKKNYRLQIYWNKNTRNKKTHYTLSHAEIITPDGTKGTYFHRKKVIKGKAPEEFLPFYLRKERYPSGNHAYYSYDKDHRLSNISTFGPQKITSYCSAHIKYFGKKEKDHDFSVISQAGEKISYRFLRPPDGAFHNYFYLNEIQVPGKKTEKISYTKEELYSKKLKLRQEKKGPLVEVIKLENQKTIKVEYFEPGDNFVPVNKKIKNELLDKYTELAKDSDKYIFFERPYYINIKDKKVFENIHIKKDDRDSCCHRIKAIYLPSSTEGEWDCIYSFYYKFAKVKTDLDKLSGTTEVYDAYGNKIIYHFSQNDRVDEIEYFDEEENKISSCQFFWKKQEGGENLICKAFKDSKGNILSAKHFVYDSSGNVLKESVYGNLTGKNTSFIYYDVENDIFDQKSENYSKYYTYSQDDFHLTLSEKEDNGRCVYYKYLPSTNLLLAKYIGNSDQISERHFYKYDENHILIEIIHDNGSSFDKNSLAKASYRTIKKIHPKQSSPALYYPESIVETYFNFETNSEDFLRKTIYRYSKKAELLQEDIYDREDKKAFSVKYQYDAAKRLIKAEDPLRRQSFFAYDDNDNLILSKQANASVKKKLTYDAANRLIKEEDISPSDTRVSYYHFDTMGSKVKETSHQNLQTLYENDNWGRTVKTILPKLKNADDNYVSYSIENTYDLFGNITSITNAKDITTTISYNLYKKPVRTIFSQYRSICNLYNLDGSLAETINEEGATTSYKYNVFGKTTEKSIFSKTGHLLKKETWAYRGNLLLSYTDPLGNTTYFTYDGAKRKLKEESKEKVIYFYYDSLSRLCETKILSKENPKDGLIETYTYDLVGREIERKKLDLSKSLLWHKKFEYDAYDNKIRVIHLLGDKESFDSFVYDDFKRMLKHIDPEGNETILTYNDYYLNEDFQLVLQKTRTDPKGTSTIETYDAMQRCVLTQVTNSFGKELSKQVLYYDETGNKIKQLDHIYLDEKFFKESRTIFSYDDYDNLIELSEAAESSSLKKTYFFYDNKNRLISVIKPNRSRITYVYDELDRLTKLDTSNKKCSYSWSYFQSTSLPTCIQDHVYNQTIERDYDDLGRLISEKFPSDHVIERSYDYQNRCKKVILPDSTFIQYKYGPLYLRRVDRYGKAKTLQYCHEYLSYDLSGNLLEENMIYGLGSITTSYDLLLRTNESKSPYYYHRIDKFDANGNILEDSSTFSEKNSYQYDCINQIQTEESHHFTNSYQFDNMNNCHRKNEEAFEINALNQIKSSDDYFYSYDYNGNLVEKSSKKGNVYYQYDDLDRLVKVISGNDSYDYTYDGLNRRTSSTYFTYQNGSWEEVERKDFLYQGQEEIGAITSDKITELKILGLGKNHSPPLSVAMEINGRVYAVQHNLKGNVSSLVDAKSSKVVEYYDFDSFGNEKIFDKDLNEKTSCICPWRFQEKRKDKAELIYFGQRYYDAKLGRWLTPDPSGFSDGANLYAYTRNNPQNRLDAIGLASESRFDSAKRLVFPLNVAVCSFEAVFTLFKYALYAIGSILQFIAEEILLPIPIVQNAIYLMGKFLKLDFGPVAEKPYPYVHEVKRAGLFNAKGIILFTNGMNNTMLDAIKSGDLIGELAAEDLEVRTAYLTKRGWFTDLIECPLLKLGRDTPNSKELRSIIRNCISELGKDGILYLILHSKGALVGNVALAGMSPEERNRVVVLAYGPATIIPKSHALEARNIFSSRDPVLYLSPISYLRHKIGGTANIEIVPSKGGFPFMDHSFSSNTYQDHVTDAIQRYLPKIRREHVANP